MIPDIIKQLERNYSCKVLFACESGSRAWGFESRDSDYDVRFIFVYPVDLYITLTKPQDTINFIQNEIYDFSGWELRKTLSLFSKSNLSLNEWLDSPLIYFRNETLYTELKKLIPVFFQPVKGFNHYLSIAKNTLKTDNLCSLSIKKLFYLLRSILACSWIIQFKTMPPTLFISLLDKLAIAERINKQILSLLIKKKELRESQIIVIPEDLQNWINNQLSSLESFNFQYKKQPINISPLDRLLKQFILNDKSCYFRS